MDDEDNMSNVDVEEEEVDDEEDVEAKGTEEVEEAPTTVKRKKVHAAPNKRAKRGIIYLSSIPEGKLSS